MNGIWTSDCSLKILRGTFLNKLCPFRLLTSKRFIYAGPHLEIRFFSFGNEIAHKKYWVPHKNQCLFNYGSLPQGFFSKRFSWWLRWGLSPHLREHRICDEISLPLTFNKLELLLLPLPSPMMGIRTRVLHVWQLELNWCKHLAKAYHCELVNTGRGAAWGMGKRVEREDVSFLFLVSLEGA